MRFRASPFVAFVALVVLVATIGPIATSAGADALADKRVEAQKIAARLGELDMQMMDVSAQFEAANYRLHKAEKQVAAAQTLVDQTRDETERREAELKSYAVNAYVSGNQTRQFDALITSTAENGTVAKYYLESMSANRQDLIDKLTAARSRAEEDQRRLDQALAEAKSSANEIEKAKSAAQAARNEQAALNAKVQGELTALVQQEQEAQRARDAAAAAAAQRATASRSESGSSRSVVAAPAANGSAASIAITAMLSQMGKPYVWGAAGPDAFDCSGLILWAYAKAGISLPHYSGAMYAMTTRISESQLQPGDFVFWGSGGSEHVAIYMGGNQLVHTFRPPTGVSVTPLDGWWKPPSGFGRLRV